MRSRNTLAEIVCLMKPQSSFEIRAYIKGRVNLILLGAQTYNELCQIHRTSAVFNRVGVIKIVIVINCNLITFSKVIACYCN